MLSFCGGTKHFWPPSSSSAEKEIFFRDISWSNYWLKTLSRGKVQPGIQPEETEISNFMFFNRSWNMINPGSSRILRSVPTSEGAPVLQYIFFQNAMKVNIHLSPPMVGHWQIQGSAIFDKTVFSGGSFRENISQKVDLHYMVFQAWTSLSPKIHLVFERPLFLPTLFHYLPANIF